MKLSTNDLLRAARAERLSEQGRERLLEATLLASAESNVAPTLTPPRSGLWWLKLCIIVGGVSATLGGAAIQPWGTARTKAPHLLQGLHDAAPPEALKENAGPMDAPSATISPQHPSAPTVSVRPAPRKSEAEFLASIRIQLKEGHAAAASHELSSYFAQYPHGQLQLEARVLRVRALQAASNQAQAIEEARALLRTYPSNPYRMELEQIAGPP